MAEAISTKYLFLDIDGVLNDHTKYPNGYCGIDYKKMELLNRIVEGSKCKIVLVSAWRYMLLDPPAMTLRGFRYLLTIHGASEAVVNGLCGYLDYDKDINDPYDRSKLVDKWLYQNLQGKRFKDPRPRIVVLDDTDCGYSDLGLCHVMPDPKVGLTEWEVDMVLALFMGEAAEVVVENTPKPLYALVNYTRTLEGDTNKVEQQTDHK